MQLESFPYACDKQGASVKQLKINIQTLMFLKTSWALETKYLAL